MPRRKKKKKLFYLGVKSSGKHSVQEVNEKKKKKDLKAAEDKKIAEQKKQDKIEEKQKKKIENERIKRIENKNKEERKNKKRETQEELKQNKYTNRKQNEEIFDFEKEVVIGLNDNMVKKSNNPKIKNKKKGRKIPFTIKCTSFIALFIIIITIGLTSPVFNITEIVVEGNNLISKNAIIELSGLQTGQNMFKINTKSIISNIKNNTYVKSVQINRNLPSTIEINIIERTTKYMIECAENYIYIDNQGYLLEISQTALDIPILKGFESKDEELLKIQRLQTKDLEKLSDVLKITEAFNSYNLYENINKVDVTNVKDYVIYMEEIGKRVYIGNVSDLNNKILHLKEILKDTEGQNGSIYVNGNFNEGFNPYFRENV